MTDFFGIGPLILREKTAIIGFLLDEIPKKG